MLCSKNYGVFQSPQTVSWLLKGQLEEPCVKNKYIVLSVSVNSHM